MHGHAAFTPHALSSTTTLPVGKLRLTFLSVDSYIMMMWTRSKVDPMGPRWHGRLSSRTGGPEYEGWNGEGLKAGVVGPCLKLPVWEACFGTREGKTMVRFRRCSENI